MNKEIKDISVKSLAEYGMKHFSNEKYIDLIVEANCFHEKGSSLLECNELFEAFESEFPNAKDDKNSLKKLLSHWLPIRINYIAREMSHELNTEKTLHRAIPLPNNLVKSIENSPLYPMPIELSGDAWSLNEDTDINDANIDFGSDSIPSIITTELDVDNIDWHQTFITRIDFICGDYDREYNLYKDSVVDISRIKPFL